MSLNSIYSVRIPPVFYPKNQQTMRISELFENDVKTTHFSFPWLSRGLAFPTATIHLSLFLSQPFSFPGFPGKKTDVSCVSGLRKTSRCCHWMMVLIHDLRRANPTFLPAALQSGLSLLTSSSAPLPLLPLLQPQWPLKAPSKILPQGLCTSYFLCTNHPSLNLCTPHSLTLTPPSLSLSLLSLNFIFLLSTMATDTVVYVYVYLS